jgi:uncharacterized protein YjiS (DUF1127 family)
MAKCLFCPRVALSRAHRTRTALGELDAQELKDVGVSRSDIGFVALATADHTGRPMAAG